VAAAGSNHSYSGRYNRRLVFDLVRSAGQASRGDLVASTGLQAQTISNITRELLERGLLAETSRPVGGRGAPQKYLRVEARAGCSYGIHIDRDGLNAIACDLLGAEIARHQTDFAWPDPEATVEAVARSVRQLAAQCANIPSWGVGIAMPTLQESEFDRYVGSPGWQDWGLLPTAEAMEAACGLPVIVENDATAAAIAELHVGAAAGLKNFVYIFMGHGLGAGIVVDGLPFQGAFNNAGEIGLLSWPAELQPPAGASVTPFSLEELAQMVGCNEQALRAPDRLDLLYRERNGALMTWLDLCSARLRILLAISENMLDPETVLISGWLPEPLCASLVDRCYPLLPSVSARKRRDRPRLLAARLLADAPAIGAAMLPVIAHGSPLFRRLSLTRGRTDTTDMEARFDRVAGTTAMPESSDEKFSGVE